jgi:hypothetical protein
VSSPPLFEATRRFAMKTAGGGVGEKRTNIRVGIPGFEIDSCSTTPWSDTYQRERVGLQHHGSPRSNEGMRGSRAPWITDGADHRGCDSAKRTSLPDTPATGARLTPLLTKAGTLLHTCSLQELDCTLQG